jgi:tetratricopeptide (TPR) repeat protein
MSQVDDGFDVALAAVTALEVFKPNTLKLATAYNTFGDSLYIREEWNEARLYFEKAIRIFERKGCKSIPLANAYENLGCVLVNQCEWDAAGEYLRKAVRIYERKWFMRINLADHFFLLAEISLFQEDYEDSCYCFKRALKQYQRKSPRSSTCARCWHVFGGLVLIRGELNVAQTCYKNALKIQQKTEPSSLCVAETCGQLACISTRQGEARLARHFYERAAAIVRQPEVPRSLDLAFAYRQLAEYHYSQGERQEERVCYQMVVEIQEEIEPGIVYLIEDYFHLGWLCYNEGDIHAASNWYEKAWNSYEGLTEKRRIMLTFAAFTAANSCFGIGNVHDRQGDYAHSLPYLQNAWDLYESLGSERLEMLLRLNPRPLPATRVIASKVALNPSRLVSLGNGMLPFVWCHALAKLQGDVQAVYYILREHPHIVESHT